MTLGELLRTKSSEYELLAEWHAERAPLDNERFVACQAMAVLGIVSGRSLRRSTGSGARRQTRTKALRPRLELGRAGVQLVGFS